MTDAPPMLVAEPDSPYHDRKTGLVIFGIVEILMGGLAGALIGLMVFGQFMMAKATQQEVQLRMIVPGALTYGIAAVALITLGIGSIRTRRWARALSLVMAWAWLITGILVLGSMAIFLPSVMRAAPPGGPGMPPGAMAVVMVSAFAIVGILFILVPAVLVVFYQSRHVKATCEARDPQLRWTDACPLPVLGLSLWVGVAAISMLGMPLMMNGMFPVFGVLWSGWSGSLLYLAVAGLWVYCAMALYRLNAAGWWLMLASMGLFTASAWISFSRIDIFELYRQMGYSEAQLQMMRQFSFISSATMAKFTLAGFLPMLGYLLVVKRYFRHAG